MSGTPEVDFYILPDESIAHPLDYAVRLVEKIFRRGMRICVRVPDAGARESLSERLWSLEGFIPSGTGGDDLPAPVALVMATDGLPTTDVLLNLAPGTPDAPERFARIAELVPGNPLARQQSRTHYRVYQEKGYAIRTHTLGAPVR